MVSVRLDLENERSFAAAAVVDGELGGLANGKCVHSVDLSNIDSHELECYKR